MYGAKPQPITQAVAVACVNRVHHVVAVLLTLVVIATISLAQAQTDDPVVIELDDGTVVTKGEFDRQFDIAARGTAMQQGLPPTEENLQQFEMFRPEYLEQLATQLVLLSEAETRGLQVPEAEVEAQLTQIRASYENEADYQAFLSDAGFQDETELRSSIEDALTTQLLLQDISADVTVSQEEIEAWYDANQDQLLTEEGVIPLEEVQADIELQLMQEQVDLRVLELRQDAGVQLYPENL